MKLEWRNNRDFWSGVMFMFIGLGAIFMARDYPVGSALRMGPGYFPVALGGILFLMGLYVMVQGLIKNEKIQGNWSLRALAVLPLAIVVFGMMVETAGFVPALIVLTLVSAAAGREFKLTEVVMLAVLLAACSVALFIYALGMPYPLFGGH
ncbi:MAG TPA: tripartite tricarboxylate transporter TctB family protein [Burkholderiales bacterium]|nr:tripartite tricarboxylate transporter TctB family protein [Burkholderiales bacterium]